jgi:hypothetical protein
MPRAYNRKKVEPAAEDAREVARQKDLDLQEEIRVAVWQAAQKDLPKLGGDSA